MSLLLDPRSGSGELLPYFKSYDIEVSVTQLDFADIAMFGDGPDGLVAVGVERKVIGDLVNSMRSDRLTGHQLPGLMENYQFVFLVVEGVFKAGKSGALEVLRQNWRPLMVGSKPILYREVSNFLLTLMLKCGVMVVRTNNAEETVAWAVGLYKWFEKGWHQHVSHEAIYTPFNESGVGSRRGNWRKRTVPKLEKMVAQLDGVDRAAFGIAQRFRNMEGLVGATVEEIAEVRIERNEKGGKRLVRLGDKRGQSVFEQLREE